MALSISAGLNALALQFLIGGHGASINGNAPIIASIATEDLHSTPSSAVSSGSIQNSDKTQSRLAPAPEAPAIEAAERPQLAEAPHTNTEHTATTKEIAANPVNTPPELAGFSFDAMPKITGPHAELGGRSGLLSRHRDMAESRDTSPNAKQIAASKRAKAQFQFAESISKLRDEWNQAKIQTECRIWINPNWHEFDVECDQSTSVIDSVAALLTSKGMLYRPANSRQDWNCAYLGNGSQHLSCPSAKNIGGPMPPEPKPPQAN